MRSRYLRILTIVGLFFALSGMLATIGYSHPGHAYNVVGQGTMSWYVTSNSGGSTRYNVTCAGSASTDQIATILKHRTNCKVGGFPINAVKTAFNTTFVSAINNVSVQLQWGYCTTITADGYRSDATFSSGTDSDVMLVSQSFTICGYEP